MDLDKKAITMKDGREYLIIEYVTYEGKTYVYLVNDKDDNDSVFRELILGDSMNLAPIDPYLFENKIYPLFIKKLAE